MIKQQNTEPALTRSEQKRQAVFSAALAEFKEKGFVGASMDAIAQRAQVSKRTVYNHFTSKEGLFSAVTHSFWQKTRAAASKTYDNSRAVRPQLIEIAEQIWLLYHSDELIEQGRILLAELIRQPEFVQAAMAEVSQQDCGLVPFLRQASAAGALQIDDMAVAETQFMGMIKSFAFWPRIFQFHDFSTQRDAIIAQNVAMFLAHYQLKTE